MYFNMISFSVFFYCTVFGFRNRMLSRSFFSCDYSCEYMNTLVQCELGGSKVEKGRLQGIRESSNKNKACKLHETDKSD